MALHGTVHSDGEETMTLHGRHTKTLYNERWVCGGWTDGGSRIVRCCDEFGEGDGDGRALRKLKRKENE